MRIERLRMGLELENKVDGKCYKITSVDHTNITGIATEMIIDDDKWTGELGEGKVTITEANALAFRIVRDPEPYPIPEGYSVEEGKLMKNGKLACEAGGLMITKILATQPGYLILAVKKKGTKEGVVDLMSYQVSCDRFKGMIPSVPDTIRFLTYIGDNRKAILGYSSATEADEKNEDGTTKKVRFFDQAGLIIILDGIVLTHQSIYAPIVLDDVIVKENPEDIRHEIDAFVPSDEQVDEDGCLEKREHRVWYKPYRGQMSQFEADGKIRVDWSHAYKEFVIRTKDMIMMRNQGLTIQSPKVAALDGYNTLIDITKEKYQYRLTFSNEDYEFKTLVSKSTIDRGYIVTVE